MKILIQLYYFLRSFVLRGPLNTFRLLKAELVYEKKFGIVTAPIKRSDSKEFFHYQGAGYLTLMRLLSEVYKETAGFDFMDIGCGKGRAVFVAEYFGYDQITGIDLDEELITEALSNLKIYPFKRTGSSIRFIKANAIEYEYHNKPTVYFLFNPFSEEVMRKVVNRIVTLTRSETWFVYMNPLYPKPFEERGLKKYKEFKTGLYIEAIIFRLEREVKPVL